MIILRPCHERGPVGRLDDADSFKAAAVHFASEAEKEKSKVVEAKEEVAGMKRKLKEEEKENRKLSKQLAAGEKKAEKEAQKLKTVRDEKKKEHDQLVYHKGLTGLAKTTAKKAEDPDQLLRQLNDEIRKNTALTTENEMLRGLLEEKEEDIEKLEEEKEVEVDMMDPSDRRRFKTEVVEWIWELFRANVAHHQVPEVIKSSFKFFGKRASQIPSVPIVNDMATSCLPASQKHLEVKCFFTFIPSSSSSSFHPS